VNSAGIACLLSIAPLGGAVLAQAEPPPREGRGDPSAWSPEAKTILETLRLLRSKERPPDAELAPRLAAAGERELGLFFDVLATCSVPAPDAGSKAQTLSESQESLVLLALGQLDREAVLAEVATELGIARDAAARRAAVLFIGAVGRANDLPLLLELALVDSETALEKRIEPALRRATASILARDPASFAQLIEHRRLTRQELVPVLVAAVGDAGDPRGLEVLSEIATWHEDLLLEVMAQIRVLGPSSDPLVNESMKGRLRSNLEEGQPARCKAAMLALAALRDMESIGPLIELLGSEAKVLRDTAHWSLRNLTGLGLDATPEGWARWHQTELAWMVREKPDAFRRLRSNEPAEVSAALRAIGTHPLARDELRAALPDLLANRWPAVRILACRSLAELRARESVEKLVWTLEDREGDVSRAAHAALRTITGLDLALDPAAWQAATKSAPRPTEP
jgi:hypothetical protein